MRIRLFITGEHTVVRDGLRALLDSNSAIYVVGCGGTRRQVVSQLQALRPDVVLVDISTPNLGELQLAEQILEERPETNVIILSIVGSPEHIYRALQAGARGYLLKESAGSEVIDAVLAVHKGDVYLSQKILTTLIADYLYLRGGKRDGDPLQLLSQREREVLHWVVEGKTSAEIAEIMFLSPKTVETYRSRMMRKLDMPDLPSLVRFIVQEEIAS